METSHRHCIFIQATIKANIMSTLHDKDTHHSPLNNTNRFLFARGRFTDYYKTFVNALTALLLPMHVAFQPP